MIKTLILSTLIILTSCTQDRQSWFKGNTHAHTVLCGHADSTPEEVARWYLDRNYNFLILSEHNIYIDPATVELPEPRRDDFILIPGEEITGNKSIHTTAMNLDHLVDASFNSQHKSEIIQNHTDGAIQAGGVPILNHPNFNWAVSAADMLPVERLHMFELYNGGHSKRNAGDADHLSLEDLWDTLLSKGKLIYAVSSDDMHILKKWTTDVSNPGRGWVMVRADELTPDAITNAMARGDFYASSGVILKTVRAGEPQNNLVGSYYEVEVDEAATARELESDLLMGLKVDNAVEGYRIQWISEHGRVISDVRGNRSVQRIVHDMKYLRCKITYARKTDDGYEEFHAWTQPVFTDNRSDRIRTTVHKDAVNLIGENHLDGWHKIGGGEWSVEQGVITGTMSANEKRHGLLVSNDEYDDFIVEFDYRVLEGDSGFYFRAEESSDAVGVHGFQVEIDRVEPGGLYETAGRAWVIKPDPGTALRWHTPGKWNHVRLSAIGTHIRVECNGEVTAELPDDHEGNLKGHFALQLHGSQNMHVQYRNIRLVEH